MHIILVLVGTLGVEGAYRAWYGCIFFRSLIRRNFYIFGSNLVELMLYNVIKFVEHFNLSYLESLVLEFE